MKSLEANALCAYYGKMAAVRDVTLRIASGQIVTVVGPNGAGKSTLLAALMGQRTVTGQIALNGMDLRFASPERRVAMGMALVPESRDLFTTMTVEDNLVLGAFGWRREGRQAIRREMEAVYDLFPRLHERRLQVAGTLSGGERQMLALGRALMSRPRILMLDEPSLGLAPLIVVDIFRAIGRLKASGVGVLLVEQNARAAFQVADYAYVLEMGEVRLQGDAATVAADPRVADSYLGRNVQVDREMPPVTHNRHQSTGAEVRWATASREVAEGREPSRAPKLR